MKAQNRSKSKAPVRGWMSHHGGSSRVETMVFAILGLLALLTVAMAILSASIAARPRQDQLLSYLRSGRMAADMRTATALVHYLFEADPAAAANPRVSEKPVVLLTSGHWR